MPRRAVGSGSTGSPSARSAGSSGTTGSGRSPDALRLDLLLLARADLGPEPFELAVDLVRRLDLLELAVELRPVAAGEVLERAGLDQLLDRRRARLHLLGLVLRALDREPGVGHLVADPRRRLADPDLSLRRGVLRLDHFLLRD